MAARASGPARLAAGQAPALHDGREHPHGGAGGDRVPRHAGPGAAPGRGPARRDRRDAVLAARARGELRGPPRLPHGPELHRGALRALRGRYGAPPSLHDGRGESPRGQGGVLERHAVHRHGDAGSAGGHVGAMWRERGMHRGALLWPGAVLVRGWPARRQRDGRRLRRRRVPALHRRSGVHHGRRLRERLVWRRHVRLRALRLSRHGGRARGPGAGLGGARGSEWGWAARPRRGQPRQ